MSTTGAGIRTATPMWRTDDEQDALWVIWRPVLDWQAALPDDHPLKWAGPCTHCTHCKGVLILDYDGRGTGWYHMFDGALGVKACDFTQRSDPDTCDCVTWQAAVAAALDAPAP